MTMTICEIALLGLLTLSVLYSSLSIIVFKKLMKVSRLIAPGLVSVHFAPRITRALKL